MIRYWGITDKGVVRTQNQDSYYVEPFSESLLAAVVCDGMGGAKAGNVASALAVETASNYLVTQGAKCLLNRPKRHLARSAEVANEFVCRKSDREAECMGMGTTMVSAIVTDGRATVLNIGDSRAYHITSDGIVKVTRDHSVVEDLIHRGKITPEEARNHPQKNLITRCLGTEPKVHGDLYELPMRRGEFLLLCTDGLSNMLTDQELLYEVLHGGEPESCCQRLLDIALSRGAPDNVTVVLIQML